jgi:hypothetical protein
MKPTYPNKFFRAAKSRSNIDKNAFQNILPMKNKTNTKGKQVSLIDVIRHIPTRK